MWDRGEGGGWAYLTSCDSGLLKKKILPCLRGDSATSPRARVSSTGTEETHLSPAWAEGLNFPLMNSGPFLSPEWSRQLENGLRVVVEHKEANLWSQG